jgi:hypothetical protein
MDAVKQILCKHNVHSSTIQPEFSHQVVMGANGQRVIVGDARFLIGMILHKVAMRLPRPAVAVKPCNVSNHARNKRV